MTNLTSQQEELSTAELARGFAANDGQQQVSGSSKQDAARDVENPADGSRSTAGTTDSSRSDTDTQTDPLSTLVVAKLFEEPDAIQKLLSHPTYGPQLKSYADKEAARQLTGKTKEIETRVRNEVTLETARRHFDSLSKEDLAQELASDPKAAELYGVVKSSPPPPSQEEQGVIGYYTQVIRNYSSKLAELPEADRAKFEPKAFLSAGGDPNELLSSWTTGIDDALVAARVAAATKKSSADEERSKELELQAQRDAESREAPRPQNGRPAPPLPAVDDPKTTGMTLLADAFARAPTRR